MNTGQLLKRALNFEFFDTINKLSTTSLKKVFISLNMHQQQTLCSLGMS